MKTIDLNCDLGEGFGAYEIGSDANIVPLVSSVNIACGYHGGDPMVMQKTIALAKEHGTAVGAHPGFPDLMGFGRRELKATPNEVYCYTIYQLGALDGFARAQGMKLQHMKAHGALYNMAGKDFAMAEALCCAVRDFGGDLIILALSGSKMVEAANKIGVRCAAEFFADRAYLPDGNLAPRSMAGAVIHDTAFALERAVKMAKFGKVATIDGTELAIECNSICVHGDNPSAIDFVRAIRRRFAEENIAIAAFGSFL